MFCPSCGAPLPEGSKFCPNCGERTYEPVSQQVQPPPDPPSAFEPGAYAAPQGIPWHSRGRLSPLYPGARRVTFGLIAALTVFQAILFFVLVLIADSLETEMLTAQLVGFIPTVVLIVYLFCLDTIEKEPPGLLLKLFLVEGLLTMLVVAYVELALEGVVSAFVDEDTLLFAVLDNLVCVALVEEGFKFFVLKKFTWKHPAFNYRFDAIVYAAATALGFAAFENFFYILDSGIGTALTRMISAVPGHCVDGILMGIFYGKAKLLEAKGDRAGSRRNLFLALLAPIAEHGFYDFFANVGDETSVLLFYAYVFILNASVFVLVWRLAQQDEAIISQSEDDF